jgi:lysophospholipase L1-like esterase
MVTNTKKLTAFRLLCTLLLSGLLLIFVNDAQALALPTIAHPSKEFFQTVPRAIKLVAFGDSNSTPSLPGTTSWFRLLQGKILNYNVGKTFAFTFVNLSVDAKTVSENIVNGQNQQFDIQGQLNKIDYAHFGFVMLGTNDATSGIPVATFQSYYQQLITTVKASGKIGKLYILAVPPMINPFNCIGPTCWNNTHNPQTERVVPFNTYLSTIATYCASIGFNCRYINSANGIQQNASYLNVYKTFAECK